MDFNEVYVAGTHQKQRLKERTNEEYIYDMIRKGSLVLSNGKNKFFKYKGFTLPVRKDDNNGVNVIKTVLRNDIMFVYEEAP